MISQSIGFSANCIGLDLLGSDSFGMGKVEGFVSLNGLWFRLDWMGLHWVLGSGLWIPYWIGFDFETFWDWLFDAHLSSGKWITLLWSFLRPINIPFKRWPESCGQRPSMPKSLKVWKICVSKIFAQTFTPASQHIQTYSNICIRIQTYPKLLRIQTYPKNLEKRIQTYPNVSKRIQTYPNVSNRIQTVSKIHSYPNVSNRIPCFLRGIFGYFREPQILDTSSYLQWFFQIILDTFWILDTVC